MTTVGLTEFNLLPNTSGLAKLRNVVYTLLRLYLCGLAFAQAITNIKIASTQSSAAEEIKKSFHKRLPTGQISWNHKAWESEESSAKMERALEAVIGLISLMVFKGAFKGRAWSVYRNGQRIGSYAMG